MTPIELAEPSVSNTTFAKPGFQGSGFARAVHAPPNLGKLVENAKRQMSAITGLSPDTISEWNQSEDGWTLNIDMLEHKSVPRTQDLLSSFEVVLDDAGQVTRWRRTSRFVRGQSG